MGAKSIQVSEDGVTYVTLPGSSGSLDIDKASTDDSVFGTNFVSSQQTLKSWSISANGYFKGFPGYRATLRRAGTPTAFTAEATTAKDGGFYITDRTKSIWVIGSVTVLDDGEPVAASNIDYIDYLHGGVFFVSGYIVEGPVTVTGNFRPTSRICYAQTFSLTNSSDTENITDLCEANDNGGFSVFGYQQQSVELTLDGFYNDSADFIGDILADDIILIEVNPDGENKSVARGFFQASSLSNSGDIGSTEAESITYQLNVPEGIRYPFRWYHATDSAIPVAVKMILDAWEARTLLYVRYQAEGSTAPRVGQAIVADTSLDSGVEDINEFTFEFQGTGELEVD